MPKKWKKCTLCHVNSFTRPDLVIFQYKHLGKSKPDYICELHFDPGEMRNHAGGKR